MSFTLALLHFSYAPYTTNMLTDTTYHSSEPKIKTYTHDEKICRNNPHSDLLQNLLVTNKTSILSVTTLHGCSTPCARIFSSMLCSRSVQNLIHITETSSICVHRLVLMASKIWTHW